MEQEQREVISGGRLRPLSWTHLVPTARFLIEERGHLPLYEPERWGFTSSQAGGLFQLSRRITDEDWDAVQRRFVLPPNIVFYKGLIRDQDNGVTFLGVEELVGNDGVEPIEVREVEESPTAHVRAA